MTLTSNNKNLANDLASQILNDLQAGNNVTTAHILQTSMNMLMQAERNLHLEQNPTDKGNGSFERKLGTPMGELTLTVPRDRDGDFRPAILPQPYQRDYAEREELLESLLLSGYSPQQIQMTLRSLNLHYNPEEISALKKYYHQLYIQWQNRELPHDAIGLFVDAYHADALISEKVCKVVIYVVIGIDFTGHKSLFGIYLYTGNESKGFWLQTFNQLISRGVKCPLFIVSDDFSGLKEAVLALFPQTFHQLCLVHMQRNVYKNMAKKDAQVMNQSIQAIKLLPNVDVAIAQFQSLCEQFSEKYPTFMKVLSAKSSHYFAFVNLPQEIKKYFYSTNSVESFNSILEKLRVKSGGFFQSEEYLRINIFFTLKRLHYKKWKRGAPHIVANLYSLRQLFVKQFGRLPIETAFLFDNNSAA